MPCSGAFCEISLQCIAILRKFPKIPVHFCEHFHKNSARCAEPAQLAAAGQRLVYGGRVLEDGAVLAALDGLADGHTVHVRGPAAHKSGGLHLSARVLMHPFFRDPGLNAPVF